MPRKHIERKQEGDYGGIDGGCDMKSLSDIIEENKEEIAKEILADPADLRLASHEEIDAMEYSEWIEIDGQRVRIGLSRVRQ